MTEQTNPTADTDDVEGHIRPRPGTMDGTDDVEGHRLASFRAAVDGVEDDVEGHVRPRVDGEDDVEGHMRPRVDGEDDVEGHMRF